MTRRTLPVNIFIAVDWTQGPLSKVDTNFHLNDPLCTGFLVSCYGSHGYPGDSSFVPLDYVNICMSSKLSWQRQKRHKRQLGKLKKE